MLIQMVVDVEAEGIEVVVVVFVEVVLECVGSIVEVVVVTVAICNILCKKSIKKYSKASRYTASRSTDLGDTRFLIGSLNT